MRSFNFFGRLCTAFHDYPSLSKIIVVSTLRIIFDHGKSDINPKEELQIFLSTVTLLEPIQLFSLGWHFVCSSGSLIAYSEANTNNRNRGRVAHADAVASKKKKVVVLGTGWAAMTFLKNLNNCIYEVEVVSPRNFFLFTPLLPSVTCGKVEARSIVEPIHNIIRKKNIDVRYREAESTKKRSASRRCLLDESCHIEKGSQIKIFRRALLPQPGGLYSKQ
ncbi:hypothetical protein GOBAR_DD11244 [Gossypium barbadense]|nr:hypothetical protein GOBAR_DD11244 [Gossypium barbadense]